MAATVVGTAVSDGNTGFASDAVAGAANGDRAFIFGCADNTSTAAISGWTQVFNNSGFDGSSSRSYWYKDLTSSDVSASISGCNTDYSFIMVVVTDHDAAIDPTSTTYYTLGSIDTDDIPSHGSFATGDLSMIVGFTQDDTGSMSSPSGYSTALNNSASTATQFSVTVFAYRNDVSGTVNPGQWSGRPNGQFMGNLHVRVPQAASGGTGTISATEAADTASLSGDVLVQGAISATEATDTAAIAGDVLVQGTIAATETGDTAAFAGDVIVQGTIAATDSADTAAFAGNVVVQGTIAATDAPDTAALAGTVLVQGTIGATEVPDTASIDGAVLVQGTIAATEPTDTAALAGDVIVSGALSATEGSDTASFTGTVSGQATGTISATEAPDTASVSGEVLVQGTLAANDNADTAAFTGLVLVQGSLDATEESDTATFTGLGALAPRVATAPHANDSITFARPSPVTNTRPGMVASSRPAAAGGSRPRQASTGVR